MPLPGSAFNPGGQGYGSGVGMGGYNFPSNQTPGYARSEYPMTDPNSGATSNVPMWLDPGYQQSLASNQASIQSQQAGTQQQHLANMFRQLLMGVLFGSVPGMGGGQGGMGASGAPGGGGFQPASQIPGFDPKLLMGLLGRGSSSSPFNPNFGSPQMPPMGALMGGR